MQFTLSSKFSPLIWISPLAQPKKCTSPTKDSNWWVDSPCRSPTHDWFWIQVCNAKVITSMWHPTPRFLSFTNNSMIYRLNRAGLRTEPWRVPFTTLNCWDLALPSFDPGILFLVNKDQDSYNIAGAQCGTCIGVRDKCSVGGRDLILPKYGGWKHKKGQIYRKIAQISS